MIFYDRKANIRTMENKIPIIRKTPFKETVYLVPPEQTLPYFRLYSSGITHKDSNYFQNRPNGGYHYTLEYIYSGRGMLRFGDHTYYPEAGDAYLLPPDIPCFYRSDSKDPWEKIWFNIGGDLPEALIECYRLQGMTIFRNCPVGNLFEEGMQLCRAHDEEIGKKFALVLHRIFLEFAAFAGERTRRRSNELAVILKRYIDANLRHDISLESMCARIQRSRVQTLRIFASEYNCTPKQYQLEQRLELARQYLKNSSYSIREIAELVGFNDEFYFSNWFKKRTGIPPREFRKTE